MPIHGNLAQTDAAVVLIGDKWLDASDEQSNRRLDAPDDWVSNEIESALAAQIPVYPVLVEGTAMPRVDELPERLHLSARLVDERRRPWHLAVAWLCAFSVIFAFVALEPIPEPYESTSMLFIAIITVLLMCVLIIQSGFRPK